MNRLLRLAIFYAGFLLILAIFFATMYVFLLQADGLQPEQFATIDQALRNPTMPIGLIRETALNSQRTVISGLEAFKGLLQFTFFICLVGIYGFVSIAVGIREEKKQE